MCLLYQITAPTQCTDDCVNMCGTADSLVVSQYVLYSGQFSGDTICVVQRTV